MKSFFKELFEYNNTINQKVIAAIVDHPGKVSEKCLNLQSHIINAHKIWNAKIVPVENIYERWQLHPSNNLAELDNENFHTSMRILERFDINALIKYSNSKGQVFDNSVRDILFQIINHSTYHRAQVASEFRQSGVEPLITDYIFYKWQ